MKIALNWLKDHISITESAENIGKKLTSSGLEVEAVETIESIKGGLKGVVVGEIITCQKHPDADKLSLTTVNVGGEELLPIVCGAPNVAAGQKVLVATVGTVIHPESEQSFTIKKAKIRGAESAGMICAEDELGLGKSHDGIMVLDPNSIIGTPAAEFLNLSSEEVIEIGLTPNRVDAASHYGVARDIQALTGIKINPLPSIEIPKVGESKIKLEVQNADACPRYCGLYMQDIQVKESPSWMKNRLLSIGVTPKNNVVDITNYILHDLGQPMHAFDVDKIKGQKIVVKRADKNQKFTALDKVERKLIDTDLVIFDGENNPLCLAGVMGGEESGISEKTTSIFLESAYFQADYVRKSSIYHGLKSDSSFRFERGTDSNMPPIALAKAYQMIKDLCGGKAIGGMQEFYHQVIPNFVFEVDSQRVKDLIGVEIQDKVMEEILGNLDIQILDKKENLWKLEVPSYRVDVQRESDIAEEVLRIFGFDNVPVDKNLASKYLASNNNIEDEKNHSIATYLANNGYYEITTNSLTKPQYAEWIEGLGNDNSVYILNKLSEEHEVLRQSLIFSGLEVVQRNINRKNSDLKLFEIGKTYRKVEGQYIEKKVLSLWLTGNKEAESWQQKNLQVQYHDLSKVVMNILESNGVSIKNQQASTQTYFSKGLEINHKKGNVVKMGMLKGGLVEKMDIDQPVFYAEIDLELLLNLQNPKLVVEELSKFPEVRRDLSIVLDINCTFEEIRKVTLSMGNKLIKELNVFDVYAGENLGDGKKSYSVSYILSDTENTLQDEVVDKVMNKLINLYESQLGATIRR